MVLAGRFAVNRIGGRVAMVIALVKAISSDLGYGSKGVGVISPA